MWTSYLYKHLEKRWLIIDEIFTVSPELLGILDLYLRRACSAHPFLCRQKNAGKRPVGGINMIFAGDFWQLTPVKSISLFANPFKNSPTPYTAQEQKFLNMFWNNDDVGSIQKTWLLTQALRSKDAWLNAVLESSRYGNQSWEMYCFNHGFPTRNPGMSMPSTDSPACGNEECKNLAEICTQMWERGRGVNWKQRQAMECALCSKERQRRICILKDSEESKARFVSEEFAAAPYVHPFRHPSYHATQLRALVFAKNAAKRFHWIVAHDSLADKISGIQECVEGRASQGTMARIPRPCHRWNSRTLSFCFGPSHSIH